VKIREIDKELFEQNYLSVVQILFKLADPTFMFGEIGRGSGKTTHILGARVDRVQNSMGGATMVLGGVTYKSILDTVLSGMMEFFNENYQRGFYYEFGKEPPRHFKKCNTFIADWKHTISFVNGAVIQLVSCDRPESMLGKNAAHLFVDELRKIPEKKFVENIIPALRSDRSKYGHSPYFMGITGFSSTPDIEADETWWLKYEENMDSEMINAIIELAYYCDKNKVMLLEAKKALDFEKIKKHERFFAKWQHRLDEIKRGQTYYCRASSFSNIKILGMDYIENQLKNIKDVDKFKTEILSIRKNKVKERFFGKFGKEHIFIDSYLYDRIDRTAIDEIGGITSRDLKYCDTAQPLYAGYDPGPFTSIVFAQRNRQKKEFRCIKDFFVIHPEQHEELAEKIDLFFKNHRYKKIFLHYDRAANQRDPRWRDYYPITGDINDTDAKMLKNALEKRGWQVELMSLNQQTIYYVQHYRLLSILFGKQDYSRDKVLIDGNECECLVSSIYHSPIKRTDGVLKLDKSSEKELDYKDQAMYSTQIATALMYLLFGEYKNLLPSSDNPENFAIGGITFSS
jgi:hypothetical protein